MAHIASFETPSFFKVNKVFLIAVISACSGLVASAQFLPGHLAVMRVGDGEIDLHLKQSPVFIDQYDCARSNAAPSYTVQIPTKGPNLFFVNGHAATEGMLTRSMDHKSLIFAGYGQVALLQSNGTPSTLDIPRGVCTVDTSGNIHSYCYKAGFFKNAKVNPRGATSDGSNHFWACGNAFGTMYYDPQSEPVRFKSFPNSRSVRIIGHAVHVLMNVSDARTMDRPAGIYRFMTASGNADPLPREADALVELVVPTSDQFEKTTAFDMDPQGKVAYVADVTAGVQKYAKAGSEWKFEYNISIPHTIPAKLNNNTGCFGLVADFSGHDPVLYATTTEGYGGSVNSNRVVRIVDTGAKATFTTIAQCTSTNIAFRGIDFTPENSPPSVSLGR